MRNFEVEILLYDPTLDEEACKELGARKCTLASLMAESDVVSVHAPSLPVTRHMINAENLSRMKDGAVLINTARGTLINEYDLIEELRKGRISACIDVTDPEPPAELNELRLIPNVILTPHIAGAVTNGRKRIGALAVAELESFMKNENLENEVFLHQMGRLA
jgi:phosphoglycerate dehydrogenase-like enzyme